MTLLYAYSLVPVLSVALLLFFTVLFRGGPGTRGLAAFLGSIAFWVAALLLGCLDAWSGWGQRFAASGSFVAAGYLHAAFDFTGQRGRWLVWAAYAVAAAITIVGAFVPGLLYDPVSLTAGPMFWPGMGLAVVAATLPMARLAMAWRTAEGQERGLYASMLVAGLVCYIGAWSNALLLSSGHALPYGMFLVLGSMLWFARVVGQTQKAADRRLLDRSLLYSALTALVSSGFLFGALTFVSENAEPLLQQYRAGAFFLLVMAAVAVEPIRRQLMEWVGSRVLPDRVAAEEIARELVDREQRLDHAERLAELGAFTSAIAHEVRNPLGVLEAYVRILERQDVDAEIVEAMQDQIDRAGHFVEDLLSYGRPRPLELRMVDLWMLLGLAASTARQARRELAEGLELHVPELEEGPLMVEIDQAQILQVLVILLDNAMVALRDQEKRAIVLSVEQDPESVTIHLEDTGPGIPEELAARLFEAFVTGRKRDGEYAGTGLGLAIARRILARHDATITAGRSETHGGAHFVIELPRTQKVLAAANEAMQQEELT